MATIKDVAKAAGVGTGTVSRALSGKGYVDSEKKKQIIKIAEQLEYDPSALLKRKNNKKVKSGLIGVVLPNSNTRTYQVIPNNQYGTFVYSLKVSNDIGS